MFIFGMSHGPMKELDLQGDSKRVSKTKMLLNAKYIWYLYKNLNNMVILGH